MQLLLSPAVDPLQKKARSFVTGPIITGRSAINFLWSLWECESVVSRYGSMHICVCEHPSGSAVQMAPREFPHLAAKCAL